MITRSERIYRNPLGVHSHVAKCALASITFTGPPLQLQMPPTQSDKATQAYGPHSLYGFVQGCGISTGDTAVWHEAIHIYTQENLDTMSSPHEANLGL